MISNWLRATMLDIQTDVCVLGSILFPDLGQVVKAAEYIHVHLIRTDTTLDGFLWNPSPLGIAGAYTLKSSVLDVFS